MPIYISRYVSDENMHVVTLIHIPTPDVFTIQTTQTYAHIVTDPASSGQITERDLEAALAEFNKKKKVIINRVLVPLSLVLVAAVGGTYISWRYVALHYACMNAFNGCMYCLHIYI
jgi:hypothetical protein